MELDKLETKLKKETNILAITLSDENRKCNCGRHIKIHRRKLLKLKDLNNKETDMRLYITSYICDSCKKINPVLNIMDLTEELKLLVLKKLIAEDIEYGIKQFNLTAFSDDNLFSLYKLEKPNDYYKLYVIRRNQVFIKIINIETFEIQTLRIKTKKEIKVNQVLECI